ncbi:hypothetical protein [Vreelandella nigrificans]|uniref:Uncharacterized protein n=1 Tax=Vreelandella nigrificans TaxID=2042704 RepID=A0A2A4HGU5_9GAMM|nr:hypothetical protein [Halomonas nigrificans]PCF94102.1 hypothetical protein CPA45_19190 [Halomonas nigrificans]
MPRSLESARTLAAIILTVASFAALAETADMVGFDTPSYMVCFSKDAALRFNEASHDNDNATTNELVRQRLCRLVDSNITVLVDNPESEISSATLIDHDRSHQVYVFPSIMRLRREGDAEVRMDLRVILTEGVYICRESLTAELYQGLLDQGDVAGAAALIREQGCAFLNPGEWAVIRRYESDEPDNVLGLDRPVYEIRSPIFQMIKTYVPKAQIDRQR